MAKIGRNAECPCGSGLKFKRCCIDTWDADEGVARAFADGAMPSSFSRAMETLSRIEGDLGPDADLVALIADRWAALQELLAPYDAVVVLGQFVMSEAFVRPDVHMESENGGLAYVIEIIAAALCTRASRDGTGPTEAPIDARTTTPARELACEIVLLEGLRRGLDAGAFIPAAGPLEEARSRAAMAYLMLRGPGWPWQEEELLGDLFGDLSEQLNATLGFDADQACALSRATRSLSERQLRAHMDTAAEQHEAAVAWAKEHFTIKEGAWREPRAPEYLAALRGMILMGEGLLLSAGDLAAEAKVEEQVAESYLSALSMSFGAEGRPFELVDRLRAAPCLQIEDRYLLTVPGADLWALRGLFESTVKGEKYAKRRGKWLENGARKRFEAALSPDRVEVGVELYDGARKVGEIDGLVVLGDVALVVEAKSATQRPGARRGGLALVRHLEDNLTKATNQMALASDVLLGRRDATLRSSRGVEIELPDFREVHPILVTLDDLSGVAPVVWQLAGSKLLPDGVGIPWVIAWHDLELVLDLVDSPIQFVHFLRARARLNQLGGRIASDELDWWMLYLDTRLYFEEDEFEEGVIQSYLSQTDGLDAWVLSEKGLRGAAPRPADVLDPGTAAIIETLVRERPPGWVAAGCALLSVAGTAAEGVAVAVAEARGRANSRAKAQRGTHGFTSGVNPMMICWVVVPDVAADDVGHYLRDLVDERLAELGVTRVLGLGIAASSPRPYDALLVIEPAVWSLPDR